MALLTDNKHKVRLVYYSINFVSVIHNWSFKALSCLGESEYKRFLVPYQKEPMWWQQVSSKEMCHNEHICLMSTSR